MDGAEQHAQLDPPKIFGMLLRCFAAFLFGSFLHGPKEPALLQCRPNQSCDWFWAYQEIHGYLISWGTSSTLGPQKPMEKWRFWTPNIWVITLGVKICGVLDNLNQREGKHRAGWNTANLWTLGWRSSCSWRRVQMWKIGGFLITCSTVDGWNPANQLRLVVYPIIFRVSYIPGGARFQPSTVSCLHLDRGS